MLRSLLTTLRLRKPDTLCVVLGAESFKHAVTGRGARVVSEPAMVQRQRQTKKVIHNEQALGRVGESIVICKNVQAYEHVALFDGSNEVTGYLLTVFFRYLRWQTEEANGRRAPMSLAVTGRPALMAQIAPVFQEAATAADFHCARILDEHACLARAAETTRSGPMLLVDAGHVGTRAYGYLDGRHQTPSFMEAAAGGQAVREAVICMARTQCNALIGVPTAARVVATLDVPAAWPLAVKGRQLDTKFRHQGPVEIVLARETVAQVVRPALEPAIEACRQSLAVLEAAAGSKAKISLAGGTAALGEVASFLEVRLDRCVQVLPSPSKASARGLCSLTGDAPAEYRTGREPPP